MEERLFPLPIVSPRFLFFDYCCFYWNTQREPLQRREQLPDDTGDECFARSITLWVAKHIHETLISLFSTLVQQLSTVIADEVLRVTHFFLYVIFLLCSFIQVNLCLHFRASFTVAYRLFDQAMIITSLNLERALQYTWTLNPNKVKILNSFLVSQMYGISYRSRHQAVQQFSIEIACKEHKLFTSTSSFIIWTYFKYTVACVPVGTSAIVFWWWNHENRQTRLTIPLATQAIYTALPSIG